MIRDRLIRGMDEITIFLLLLKIKFDLNKA